MDSRIVLMRAALALVCGSALGANGESAEEQPEYVVEHAAAKPALDGQWDSAVWRKANTLRVSQFAEQLPSSDHRPVTEARVVYDEAGLYVHFRVQDQYVRSIETEYHGKVWEDAAVEFFVQPKLERGYFNFEINCGGTMLLSYHENPEYKGPVIREEGSVPWELASQVTIFHSMPKVVEPEIADDVTWHVEYFIPFSLFEAYVGPLGDVGGQTWRANFYKCAENNSHPHWATWSPIQGTSFHAPEYFGTLRIGTR
jgi:hypothetical protein